MTDETTPRLGLPYLQTGQAQKEMSHNEALALIDFAAQASVEALGVDAPPDAPAQGDCWIVGEGATGAWSGRAGAIAAWTAGGWRFIPPREGMRAWVRETGEFAVRREGHWVAGRLDGRLFIDGVQVVGPRAAGIDDPSDGDTIDSHARTAINAILKALREHGLVEPAEPVT